MVGLADRCGVNPAHLPIGTFELAVQRLNSFCENGEVRETEMALREWKISQVEKLIGLSRRDIQRACYSGRGGVAILQPENSSWGKRVYGVEDLAKLFVVKCHREKGLSLVESKEAFDRFGMSEKDYSLLDVQVSLMLAERDELDRRIACGQLLAAATEDKGSLRQLAYSCVLRAIAETVDQLAVDDQPACFALLRWCASASDEELDRLERTVGAWVAAGEAPCSVVVQKALSEVFAGVASETDGVSVGQLKLVAVRAITHPAIEPALELWLGPGSFEFIDEAITAAQG